ncbi:hypothetical protein MTR_5g064380 [Medicago truncatula]|uniref:Uncharacterized protein n=1 Tax=Medicago truncatula TaxID=3880 RepID=G7KBC2_MEDTR|nr:hypothetical protein MTR_5g064380 [Medicago truncatula]
MSGESFVSNLVENRFSYIHNINWVDYCKSRSRTTFASLLNPFKNFTWKNSSSPSRGTKNPSSPSRGTKQGKLNGKWISKASKGHQQ